MKLYPGIVTPALGVILPSSNRMVERVTQAILRDFPGVDSCFSRVPYAGHPADGYDLAPFQQAAALLAQAKPGILLWNATRGALLGFEPDRQLCALLGRETGITCTTTALATIDLLHGRGLLRIGLLSQGDAAEAARLTANFAREGIEIVDGQCLNISDNFEAANVTPDQISERCRVILDGCKGALDAILIWSTNLNGHGVADRLSEALGLPVLDSCSIGTRHALEAMAAPPPA